MSSAPEQPARRSLPWAAISFLALALCSFATLVVLLTGGSLDEFRSGPSWTPAAAYDEAVQESRSGDQSFVNGDRVIIVYSGSVNLRRTPGFQNKPAGDTLRTISEGSAGQVTGGPVDLDGLRWWQIRFDADEGWMAEQSSQGRVLLALQGS